MPFVPQSFPGNILDLGPNPPIAGGPKFDMGPRRQSALLAAKFVETIFSLMAAKYGLRSPAPAPAGNIVCDANLAFKRLVLGNRAPGTRDRVSDPAFDVNEVHPKLHSPEARLIERCRQFRLDDRAPGAADISDGVEQLAVVRDEDAVDHVVDPFPPEGQYQ